jgi:hypothetical protein
VRLVELPCQQSSDCHSIVDVATYTANREHLGAARLLLRAIEPRELNWPPARERRVVVAGIMSNPDARAENSPKRARSDREDAEGGTSCAGRDGRAVSARAEDSSG